VSATPEGSGHGCDLASCLTRCQELSGPTRQTFSDGNLLLPRPRRFGLKSHGSLFTLSRGSSVPARFRLHGFPGLSRARRGPHDQSRRDLSRRPRCPAPPPPGRTRISNDAQLCELSRHPAHATPPSHIPRNCAPARLADRNCPVGRNASQIVGQPSGPVGPHGSIPRLAWRPRARVVGRSDLGYTSTGRIQLKLNAAQSTGDAP
jgi:hypothetical protein